MNTARFATCLFIGLCFVGCGQKGGGGGSASTNLSVVVWPSFPPTTNSYRHVEHLQQLQRKANALIATNSALFSQLQARGNLAGDSPLRSLLSIPSNEPATISCSQTIDHRFITVRSSTSQQRFGRLKLNLKTGLIESAYDVQALFVISEMERRLRQVVGTREEALRLFRGGLPELPSSEQEQAARVLTAALLLPSNMKLYVQMSAPGGSNRGQGYLTISALSLINSLDCIARVVYPTDDNLFSAFGLSRPGYRFGGLSLSPAWTNLNTQGFQIDSAGYPYPKAP
jgi:hypothetical protein